MTLNFVDSLAIYSEDIYIPLYDHGYVRLVDVMPRLIAPGETLDYAIIDAARTSYQTGTQRKRSDSGLINYLFRNKHTSPFEQVIFKFEIRAPLFVIRQWQRHRTASLNEESARYSEVKDQFWLPENVRAQDSILKQGSSVSTDLSLESIRELMEDSQEASYKLYKDLLDQGLSREQARAILPVSSFSSMVWTMDLHNLLHFLKLRLDHHAQEEIRVYAKAIASFVETLCPLTWAAFLEYEAEGANFSKKEIDLICSVNGFKTLIDGGKPDNFSVTEWTEFLKKANRAV